MEIKLPEQLETSRLIIKKHTAETSYIQLWTDAVNQNLAWLNKFLPRFNEPMTFEKEKEYMKRCITEEKEIGYGIWKKETNELIGSTSLFSYEKENQKSGIEIGIIILKKFAGNGYAPEVITKLKEVLFATGLDYVIAKIDKDNTNSRHAAEKAGFKWDGKEMKHSRNSTNLLCVYRNSKESH